ncbi:SDR family oxidoreductase [Actinopolymorpha sp. B17G11]|uniref:SDR family oxidoreductase n=1 Tax=Actinopolymorpha sp. B17G11 TaxID=3160861 RepID=UPI0032E397CD
MAPATSAQSTSTQSTSPTRATTLVTGVTGYVGGRLVTELVDRGTQVRVLTRSTDRIHERPWFGDVEVIEGDANDPDTLARALTGVDTAYYLIHAMGKGRRFVRRDRRTATRFARAAERAHVGRIVYLGGIIPTGAAKLSPHLRSREEVGQIFLGSGVPTVALRAAVIIGSGSTSFEMLRYLTERLPVMTTPRWVRSRIQPIAIRDVLWYLAECSRLPPETNRTFDIGGPEILTYEEMMRRFAAIEGLRRRWIVPLPVLSPKLSSYWVGLVTPVPKGIAKPLVASLRYEVVCHDDDIAGHLGEPPGGRLGFDAAASLALERTRGLAVALGWSSAADAAVATPSDPLPTDPAWSGGSLYVEQHSRPVKASRDVLWSTIEGMGGDRGWHHTTVAWQLRGLVDRLAGGTGARRGRRDPDRLRVGDRVDWWRVEVREPDRLLRLHAEMRLPGNAWLELQIDDDGTSRRLVERSVFVPRGLAGHAYWWLLKPFHGLVYEMMLRDVVRTAESAGAAIPASPASPAGR